ncbi:hypothetical protein XENTR_v10008913 [Xenopus tropicalis]|nr:hypothetical protein XENTR_v10008913 [Xenopus tropicalis]
MVLMTLYFLYRSSTLFFIQDKPFSFMLHLNSDIYSIFQPKRWEVFLIWKNDTSRNMNGVPWAFELSYAARLPSLINFRDLNKTPSPLLQDTGRTLSPLCLKTQGRALRYAASLQSNYLIKSLNPFPCQLLALL